MWLSRPGNHWEKWLSWASLRRVARARAMERWMGSVLVKLELCSQPVAEVLSPMLSKTVNKSIGGPNLISITRPM